VKRPRRRGRRLVIILKGKSNIARGRFGNLSGASGGVAKGDGNLCRILAAGCFAGAPELLPELSQLVSHFIESTNELSGKLRPIRVGHRDVMVTRKGLWSSWSVAGLVQRLTRVGCIVGTFAAVVTDRT